MRFPILLIAFPLLAQTPDPTLQKLLVEVQTLRVAIERSTLLGARTQIAMQRIQMQETRTSRLAQTLDGVRREITELGFQAERLAARIKELEDRSAHVDPNLRKDVEAEIKQLKREQEQMAGIEQQRHAREAEIVTQHQLEQGRLTDLQARVDEMERALDSAIRSVANPRP